MKFHQVPLGQRFEFEGKWYVKTRPLTATHEASGETRVIRRSADVTLQSARVAASQAPQTLDVEAVGAALEVFYGRCIESLQRLEGEAPAGALSAAQQAIDRARKEFLKTLCISS